MRWPFSILREFSVCGRTFCCSHSFVWVDAQKAEGPWLNVGSTSITAAPAEMSAIDFLSLWKKLFLPPFPLSISSLSVSTCLLSPNHKDADALPSLLLVRFIVSSPYFQRSRLVLSRQGMPAVTYPPVDPHRWEAVVTPERIFPWLETCLRGTSNTPSVISVSFPDLSQWLLELKHSCEFNLVSSNVILNGKSKGKGD